MKRYLLFAYYTDQQSGALSNYIGDYDWTGQALKDLADYEWYDILDTKEWTASVGNWKTETKPEFQPLTTKQ